jgi:hypothetical protein
MKPADAQSASPRLPAPGSAAAAWFGGQFHLLDPLLQDLHRHGGRLHGVVKIEYGTGLAGWIGRRLCHRLGLAAAQSESSLQLCIEHNADGMRWERRFGSGDRVVSLFRPVGKLPDGYWIEQTGAATLKLTVDVIDGGWHWRCLQADLRGVRLPSWFYRETRAGKWIAGGKYCFRVCVALPLLGMLFSYGGALVKDAGQGSCF